jgi:hypothetical protein
MKPTIAIVNESTALGLALSGDQGIARLAGIVAALQKQITRDFAPIWDRDANLLLAIFPTVNPENWQLVLLDDPDQANALGYHDLTATGLPLGKVFIKADLEAGTSWTVTMSHELLEMLADPLINLASDLSIPGMDQFYALEVCDPCEADKYAYEIDGVLVSDFVTPWWFVNDLSGGVRAFDVRGQIDRPFQILPGGYISVYMGTRGWTQIEDRAELKKFFSNLPQGPEALRGSRRWRRRMPRSTWRNSRIGAPR